MGAWGLQGWIPPRLGWRLGTWLGIWLGQVSAACATPAACSLSSPSSRPGTADCEILAEGTEQRTAIP